MAAGPDYALELAVALDAARLAAVYALAEYELFTPVPDAPATISTHVDRACQDRIVHQLLARFPADGMLAEEATLNSRRAGTSGRVWVVDPIDGTRGFARKTGEFSVMIALAVGGEAVVGVVAEPAQGRVTFATRGGGCWVRHGDAAPVQCRVSGTPDLAAATLTQSHTQPGRPAKPVVEALRPGRVVETYSAGVKLAQVARGEADVYANDYRDFNDWDVAAGHVLVTEAGGTVTLFDGTAVSYGGPATPRRGLLATNGRFHAAAVERLRGVRDRDG